MRNRLLPTVDRSHDYVAHGTVIGLFYLNDSFNLRDDQRPAQSHSCKYGWQIRLNRQYSLETKELHNHLRRYNVS